ncbi:hypothetical protein Pfo_010134, partial [Paulownia fortunei]
MPNSEREPLKVRMHLFGHQFLSLFFPDELREIIYQKMKENFFSKFQLLENLGREIRTGTLQIPGLSMKRIMETYIPEEIQHEPQCKREQYDCSIAFSNHKCEINMRDFRNFWYGDVEVSPQQLLDYGLLDRLILRKIPQCRKLGRKPRRLCETILEEEEDFL